MGFKGDFAVETLAGLGFPPATTPHRGGETAELQMLDEAFLADDGIYAATFRKPRTIPAAFEPALAPPALRLAVRLALLPTRPGRRGRTQEEEAPSRRPSLGAPPPASR